MNTANNHNHTCHVPLYLFCTLTQPRSQATPLVWMLRGRHASHRCNIIKTVRCGRSNIMRTVKCNRGNGIILVRCNRGSNNIRLVQGSRCNIIIIVRCRRGINAVGRSASLTCPYHPVSKLVSLEIRLCCYSAPCATQALARGGLPRHITLHLNSFGVEFSYPMAEHVTAYLRIVTTAQRARNTHSHSHVRRQLNIDFAIKAQAVAFAPVAAGHNLAAV